MDTLNRAITRPLTRILPRSIKAELISQLSTDNVCRNQACMLGNDFDPESKIKSLGFTMSEKEISDLLDNVAVALAEELPANRITTDEDLESYVDYETKV